MGKAHSPAVVPLAGILLPASNLFLFLVRLCGGARDGTVGCRRTQALSNQKWHYKIEHIIVKEPMQPAELHQVQIKLDDLGGQGWEAVTAVPSGTQLGHLFVLFKRPRE